MEHCSLTQLLTGAVVFQEKASIMTDAHNEMLQLRSPCQLVFLICWCVRRVIGETLGRHSGGRDGSGAASEQTASVLPTVMITHARYSAQISTLLRRDSIQALNTTPCYIIKKKWWILWCEVLGCHGDSHVTFAELIAFWKGTEIVEVTHTRNWLVVSSAHFLCSYVKWWKLTFEAECWKWACFHTECKHQAVTE